MRCQLQRRLCSGIMPHPQLEPFATSNESEGVLGGKYTYKNVPGIHSGYRLHCLALASSIAGAFGLCFLLAFAFLVAAAAAAFGIGFTHCGLEAGVVLLI